MKIDENNSPFRDSLKGFNKSDVVAYIQRLSRDYGSKEDKYKDEISKLTLDIDKYKDDVNKLLSEVRSKDSELIELKKETEANSAFNEEIEALKLEGEELRKNNEELQTKNAELQSKLDESAKMLAGASDANLQAVNELSEAVQKKNIMLKEKDELLDRKDEEIKARDSVIDEKNTIIADLKSKSIHDSTQPQAQSADEQKIYEQVMSKLGSVVYSAEKSAEDIIAKAKADAEDIIARANMKKLAVLEENNKINSELKARYNFIKVEHEKISEGFKLMSEQYSAKLIELQGKLDNIGKGIERD